MLLIILFWAWAVVVGVGLGLGLMRALEAVWGRLPSLLTSSPELLIIGGLSVLAWLGAVLSFLLPIALPLQLVLSGIAGALLLSNRNRLRQLLRDYRHSWRLAGGGAAGLAAACAVLVLVHAAQPPVFPDSALYHAQFIQWMHRYPVVPGLGNLRGQLAFNSHAHLLAAFFSPAGPLGRGPAFQQTVSSLGFLLVAVQHVRRAGEQLRVGGRPWLAIFYLGSLVLLLMVLRPWISSPLADSTAAVLGLLLLGILLEMPRLSSAGLVWVGLLAATTVTVKPSAGALLLLPLVAACWPAQRRGSRLRRLAGATLVVLLPWLGRNVVLSGYLVYPLAGRVGPVVREWAVPPAQLAADLTEIHLFARRPLGDWPLAAEQSVQEWLPPWWAQQEVADKILLGLLLAGVGVVLGWLCWQLLIRKTPPGALGRRPVVQLYGLLLLSLLGWFNAAPALRFAYAYLIGATTLVPLIVFGASATRWGRVAGWTLGILSFAYVLNGLRHELAKPAALTTHVLWPADYPQVRTRVVRYLGPYPLRTNGRCGNSPLPCTDTPLSALQLRGATLGQGFRMADKPTDLESSR